MPTNVLACAPAVVSRLQKIESTSTGKFALAAMAVGFPVTLLVGFWVLLAALPFIVPFLDSTGANVMEGLSHKARRRGVHLFVSGANADIRRALGVYKTACTLQIAALGLLAFLISLI